MRDRNELQPPRHVVPNEPHGRFPPRLETITTIALAVLVVLLYLFW